MKRAIARLLLTAVCFLSLEALVFRTHFYSSKLEPESTTGHIELVLGNELRRYEPGNKHQVIAVGDSRMGLYPRVANELKNKTGHTFASISVGGATMRSWYYMLRRVDPDANRYAAVIIPVDDYDDIETEEDMADRLTDLNYSISNLRLGDTVEFARSYHSRDRQIEIFKGALFKGSVYKRDFQAFLLNPKKRLKDVKFYQRNSAGWYYGYVGEPRTLDGLSVDWSTMTATFPPGLSQHEQDLIKVVLLHGYFPRTGNQSAYRRQWLGKIVDHYAASNTKLIFLRLPRGPILRPSADQQYYPQSSIRGFASRPNVVLLPEHTFDGLEQTALFGDPLHMNAQGCTRFSQELTREVVHVLHPDWNLTLLSSAR